MYHKGSVNKELCLGHDGGQEGRANEAGDTQASKQDSMPSLRMLQVLDFNKFPVKFELENTKFLFIGIPA